MPYIPFRFFKWLFVTLAVGVQFLMYSVTKRELNRIYGKTKKTGLYLPVLFMLMNIPLLLIHFDPGAFEEGFARDYVMMPFYAYETLSVVVALVAILTGLLKLLSKAIKRFAVKPREADIKPSESRRAFIRTGAIGLGAYTFAGSLHSIYTREDYRIDRVKLYLNDLPPQLEGLTISMISDIHSGMYMLEDDMLKYTEAVNNLGADLIVMPGDFITSQNSEILPLTKAFSGLKSKYGIYTCLGNHDFFANPNYITGKLRDSGFKVLRNETEELEINGAKLILSGVDDGRHANFKKVAFEAASLNTARILLCHKPYFFESAVAGKFDLMLSGHTHGGQIVLMNLFGMKLTPAALASQYISGSYKMANSLMYVSRGVGTVGLPIRVNCPPEITLFTLGKTV